MNNKHGKNLIQFIENKKNINEHEEANRMARHSLLVSEYSNKTKFKLSPSSLNLLNECPRCFWLKMVKKIYRPRGPMSSIPIRMDSIIKNYFDRYRNHGQLPPIIDGQVSGCLALKMPKTLKYELENGITIWGRPDDYLKLEDKNIVAFDHKTKSKEPDNIHPSYQLQMNVYSYLLKKMGYKTTNKAYLAFYFPDECDLHNGMPFNCKIIEIRTNHDVTKKLLLDAFRILNGSIPEAEKNCSYCKWIDETKNELRNLKNITWRCNNDKY